MTAKGHFSFENEVKMWLSFLGNGYVFESPDEVNLEYLWIASEGPVSQENQVILVAKGI